MVVLRKHNDLQENTGRQFNEIMKNNDQKYKLNKKIEIIQGRQEIYPGALA